MGVSAKAEVRTYKMLINGQWVESALNQTFPVYDPSTEEVIARVPDANTQDVDRAVAAARAAFDSGPWSQTTPQARGQFFFRVAQLIRNHTPELAELETRNCGKPIVESEYDMADAATCFEYYGGMGPEVLGPVDPG